MGAVVLPWPKPVVVWKSMIHHPKVILMLGKDFGDDVAVLKRRVIIFL
jgi:hypothetical protein